VYCDFNFCRNQKIFLNQPESHISSFMQMQECRIADLASVYGGLWLCCELVVLIYVSGLWL
jgi:hypothetical protein